MLTERGKLLAQAAEEVRKLGDKIKLTPKEVDAQRGYRQLAIRLREDNQYAYLPRVLAEAGLLPGYSFPADPGSVSLGYDPEPVFGGRMQAQREFAPARSSTLEAVAGGSAAWRCTGRVRRCRRTVAVQVHALRGLRHRQQPQPGFLSPAAIIRSVTPPATA